MKLAFVVQRYGREILGGSETLARQLAERLGRKHDITVLTTTAKDYITWKNEYEPGEEKQRGVRVVRFPVVGERNLEEFNKFSEEIYKGEATREQEIEWLDRQGPVTPELIEHLEKEHHRYDQIIFFTYLYYPTFYGLKVAPEKSMLLPTAHDEPPLRLSIFREMFQLPNAFLFNTEAEEMLVLDRFSVHKKMRETVGVGMELLDVPDGSLFRKKHDLTPRYFLYAGRIDAGKGLEELLRFFTFYKEEHPETGNLQLVLIGKLGMKLPEDPSIHYAGFVGESEKLSAMGGAIAVIQPSRMESLSIVTLESFAVGTPVIASSGSKVLVDHCRRSNAGFYYGDFEEFEEVVNLLLSSKDLGRGLGKNGQRYVKENYGWQKLLSKYELALRSAARPSKDDFAPTPPEERPPSEAPPKLGEDEPRKDARAPREERLERKRDPRPRRDDPEPAAVSTESSEPDRADPDPSEDETLIDARAAVAGAILENAAPKSGETTAAAEDSVDGAEANDETRGDARSTEPTEASNDAPESPKRVESSEPEPEPESDAELRTQPMPIERRPDRPKARPEPEPAAESVSAEPVSEDVEHLPSFFRASVPSSPTPASPAPKPQPTVRTPPPPPPPPLKDGELPAFFQPRSPSDAEENEPADEEQTSADDGASSPDPETDELPEKNGRPEPE